MIVTEHSIRAIVATIPAIDMRPTLSKTPSFHWGNKAELARYLKLKKKAAYPLVWLLPSADDYSGNGQQVDKDCVFIIATKESKTDILNDVRYALAFDVILNPLTNRLIHGLDVSTITDLADREWSITKFPNYSEDDASFTNDVWDAIQLTISVRFNNTSNCLKSIDYGEL